MVSMDNCSHNGDKLYVAINTFAEKWEENKLTDAGFRAYVNLSLIHICSGSYGTNLENDLPDMIRSLKGRIHFAHVRNLKFNRCV